MASLQALTQSIETQSALDWLSNFFSDRIGSKLCVSISEDTRHFIVTDDLGIAIKVLRIDLGDTFHEPRVSTVPFENEPLIFISRLFYFSSKNEGDSAPWFDVVNGEYLEIRCDFISFIYFHLTRLEELIPAPLDRHERYQHTNSSACRNGYTSVPVVDHWVLAIRFLYAHIRSNFTPRSDKYELLLSHDVDVPFKFNFNDITSVLRFLAGRVYRRDFELFKAFFKNSLGRESDPADTFDFIMHHSERLAITSHFNFFGGRSSSRWDGNYTLKQDKVQNLLRRIINRSHKVGVHFSYDTFRDSQRMRGELTSLADAVQALDHNIKIDSARMHYLRWSSWETASHLAQSGIAFDTSLGFAEHVGFRAGTCFPYRPFDPETLSEIPITIIPLVAMEGSVWGKDYMSIQGQENILSAFTSIIDRVREVNGVFNMLWHNSDLTENWQKDIYLRVIEYAASP